MHTPDLSTDEATVAFLAGLRCRCDRQAIAAQLIWQVPSFLCASEAAAWAERGWRPGRYPVSPPGTDGFTRETRDRRWPFRGEPRRTETGEVAFRTGRPPDALPVECDCDWSGLFGSVWIEEGVIRRPACVADAHPPLWRGEGLECAGRACECGRQALLYINTTHGGAFWPCAGDLLQPDGTLAWRETYPSHLYGTRAYRRSSTTAGSPSFEVQAGARTGGCGSAASTAAGVAGAARLATSASRAASSAARTVLQPVTCRSGRRPQIGSANDTAPRRLECLEAALTRSRCDPRSAAASKGADQA